MKYIEGDLIKLAKEGKFDLVAHGANCFCVMGGGIARQIREEISEAYEADCKTVKGDITKLGNYTHVFIKGTYTLILNCYTQYGMGGDKINIDYEAVTLCMRKINHNYKGLSIGLPQIGAGLAGGNWARIEKIINEELIDLDVTIVIFNPPTPPTLT